MTLLEIGQAIVTTISIISGILALFGWHKQTKKTARVRKIANTIIEGVEQFEKIRKTNPTIPAKNVIHLYSTRNGTEVELNEMVQTVTTPLHIALKE